MRRSPERGRFITFEGGEGAGKTTQIRRLAERLRGKGVAVTSTREPGGCDAAEAIRDLLLHGTHQWTPLSEAFLHFAAREEHLRQVIRPALEAGRWVLCDRFADSTRAYQCFGLGLDEDVMNWLEDRVVGATRPDLTLILDAPPEIGLKRASAKTERAGRDRYEAMDRAFHARLREGFLSIAREEPERCAVVDATRDPDAVFADIRRALAERLDMELPA